MGTGALTATLDVAQIVLYAFWIFFAGLIYYLVRENHREGYPMETVNGRGTITGWPTPQPKTFQLTHGGEYSAPNGWSEKREFAAEPAYPWSGAPIEPTGDPMFDGSPKIIPLRLATGFDVSGHDVDPRGLPAIGGDGETGGIVRDLWIDQAETIFRYAEVEAANGRRVLLPMNFARVKADGVYVKSIYGHHFGNVPATRADDRITLLEEEKIMAYYGAGTLYADPSRQEPLV
jgi:photosynthetic reaction center H subunit